MSQEPSPARSTRRQFMALAASVGGGLLVATGPAHTQSATPAAPPHTDITANWDLEAFVAAGYQPPNAYQSPSYGYSVTWSDAWQLNPEHPNPINSMPNWGETGRDDLFLAPAPLVNGTWLVFSSRADDGISRLDRFAEIQSGESGQRVLWTDPRATTWVDGMAASTPDVEPAVFVNTMLDLADGAILFVWLRGAATSVIATLPRLGDVLLDDVPAFGGLPMDEITAAIDAFVIGA